MKKTMYYTVAAAALAMLLLGGVAPAHAADKGPDGFPKKNITCIVPFAAGGGTDIAARGFLKVAEKYIDTKFLVTNITGAAGWNAWTQSLGAPRDGYNLVLLTINLFMPNDTGKTYKDFTPLAALSVYPTVIAVTANSEFKTLADIIKKAKANPGTLRWGVDGLNGVDHVKSMQLAKDAGIDIRFVPFKGGADTIAAALGGNIDVIVANTPETAGRDDLRHIAIMQEERVPTLSDVPTLKELGYNIVVTRFRIMGTQADVPAPILAYLENVFEKAGKDPEWINFANSVKADPRYMNRKQSQTYMDQMFEVMAPIFKKN